MNKIKVFLSKVTQYKGSAKRLEEISGELKDLNKKLDKLVGCIESNNRYGGAIKTTPATRY